MTKTPTSYRETLFGILPQREIEQMITDNLALVQKYSIRHSTQLTLNQATVQQLHRLLAGNLYEMAGCYRTHDIQLGSFEPPAYFDVPIRMKDWEDDLATRRKHDRSKQQKFETCAWMIHRLLWIHPFFDYNGRIARLLGELYLLQYHLPMVDFRQTKRKEFITAVKIATAKGSLDQLIQLLQ